MTNEYLNSVAQEIKKTYSDLVNDEEQVDFAVSRFMEGFSMGFSSALEFMRLGCNETLKIIQVDEDVCQD